jgi:enoyl-CoA hydratase/carnithine racemase
VTMAIHNCRKPVIGALNGSAVGIGITMTLPMAIRIAPKTAKIGFVFARRGLVMEAGSSYFLPKLIGLSRAMHLITTGATYSPAHKLMDGVFSEVLDTPEQVLPRALEIAEDLVQNCSTVSWALMRDLMWRGPSTAEETHLLDSQVIFSLFQTPDNTEGVKSFVEKRPPKFVGQVERDAPSMWPWWTPVNTVYRGKPKL